MNRKFGKVNGSAIIYAPDCVRRVDHHHEEWDEPIFDPETGEPVIDPETGEQKTEHKTADWDTERTVLHPDADDCLHAKDGPWLPNTGTPPAEPAADGKHWEARGWTTDGNTNTRVYEQVDDSPVYRTYSKLKLYAALVSAGLWDSVKSWLEAQTVGGMNAYTAFSLAQDLSDSNEMFTAYLAQLKAALGVSDEVVEQILEAAVA